MLAWLLLFGLTVFAAFASLGVTLRAEPEGRAEAGVLWTASFIALICAPILALGYAGQLRPALVALASIACSLAAFALSARGPGPRAHARAIGGAALGLLRLPGDALHLAFEARSFAFLGLVVAALSIALSASLSWLAPSESWDGFFYHEPIVALALQNHGFGVVPLPPNMVVQAINGYPRLCEALALWFVIFTDRRLIEIGNTLAAPGLMLALYVIARRYCADRVPLLGFCAALFLMPAVLTQTRSSMIDVQVGFFLLVALHFATRPVFRLRDALAATLGMALITGAKSSALTLVPPLMIVTWARVLWFHGKARRGAALSVIAAGSSAIAGLGALTFARNFRAFGNPVWPVTFDLPALGIHWRGLVTLQQMTPGKPLRALVAQKFHSPVAGLSDVLARDYGYGVPWIVVPLGLVSVIVALAVVIRARAARRPDAITESFLLLAGLGAVLVAASPSLSIARYNVHIVALLMVAVAWSAGRMRASLRFHEGAAAATLLFTLVRLIWTDWFFGVDTKTLRALLQRSASERATMYFGDYHMPPDVARAREREIGPGDLVVFTQETAFPGVLWNEQLSNRVEYLERGDTRAFLVELEARRPKWVVVGSATALRAALARAGAEWELVGPACRQDKTEAFRRR